MSLYSFKEISNELNDINFDIKYSNIISNISKIQEEEMLDQMEKIEINNKQSKLDKIRSSIKKSQSKKIDIHEFPFPISKKESKSKIKKISRIKKLKTLKQICSEYIDKYYCVSDLNSLLNSGLLVRDCEDYLKPTHSKIISNPNNIIKLENECDERTPFEKMLEKYVNSRKYLFTQDYPNKFNIYTLE